MGRSRSGENRIRIEESPSRFIIRPYRWLAERSVRKGRRKLIHRESFRDSVLNHSGNQTVLQSMAGKKCLLTRPSLLSRATQFKSLAHPSVRQKPGYDGQANRGLASKRSRFLVFIAYIAASAFRKRASILSPSWG